MSELLARVAETPQETAVALASLAILLYVWIRLLVHPFLRRRRKHP